MKPKFMIKYGKEEHLQQLVDGKIRFAPSQTYVRLEEAQHNKGQGDLLEGKMKIKMQSARLHSIETNELIRVARWHHGSFSAGCQQHASILHFPI